MVKTMTRKFYARDTSKWIKRLSLGNSAAPISFFHFDPDLDASGTVAKAKDAYLKACEVVDGLRTKRSELEASKRYTSLGVSEQLGDAALTDALPALRRAKAAMEKIAHEIKERRAGLKLTKPDQSDEARELRAEMRKRLADMPAEARQKFITAHRDNPLVVQAIVTAPAVLSGVDETMHANMLDEAMRREHGDALDEIESLEEVLKVTVDVTDKARREVRSIIGCSDEVFDEIAKAAEANDGRAPMRRELRVVGGQEIEIPRVFDLERKLWRDASAEEIAGFAA